MKYFEVKDTILKGQFICCIFNNNNIKYMNNVYMENKIYVIVSKWLAPQTQYKQGANNSGLYNI